MQWSQTENGEDEWKHVCSQLIPLDALWSLAVYSQFTAFPMLENQPLVKNSSLDVKHLVAPWGCGMRIQYFPCKKGQVFPGISHQPR